MLYEQAPFTVLGIDKMLSCAEQFERPSLGKILPLSVRLHIYARFPEVMQHVFPRLPQVTFFPPLSPLLRLIVQVSSACHGRLHFPRLPLPTFQTFCSVSQGVLCKPLLLAARGGHKDIVEFLLEKGASPTEEDTVKLD